MDLIDELPLDVLHQQQMTQKIAENFVCDNHPYKVGEYLCMKHDQILCINCAWVF